MLKNTKKKDEEIGADEFLSVLIIEIIKASPKRPWSNLNFIK